MSFPFSVFFAAAVADLTLILPGLDVGADAGAFGLGLPKKLPKAIFNEDCFLAIVGNAENAETWAIKIKAMQKVKNSIVPW